MLGKMIFAKKVDGAFINFARLARLTVAQFKLQRTEVSNHTKDSDAQGKKEEDEREERE
jgi:hypothetical protein